MFYFFFLVTPTLKKASLVWHFFIKIQTGGICKICSTNVKSGGSGGNTTNLKNHLIRKHSDNPDIKKTFIKGVTAETDKTQQTNNSVNQCLRIYIYIFINYFIFFLISFFLLESYS